MGGADAAGCERDSGEQSAAARETRRRPAGAGALAAAGVSGAYPGAAGAGTAAAMAVAVGRPSVSAGASPAAPRAPGGLCSGAGVVGTTGEPGGGSAPRRRLWVCAPIWARVWGRGEEPRGLVT